MDSVREGLIEAAFELASQLPVDTAEVVAEVIRSGNVGSQLERRIPHHQQRALASRFVATWVASASQADRRVVSAILQTAVFAWKSQRDSLRVQLAWTGPVAGEVSFRRTEQAILEVLESAQERILLVSYAVYSISNVAEVLVRKAQDGVRLRVVIETPNRIEGQGEYDTIRALGKDIARCSALYFWPPDKRSSHGSTIGKLHVKCAVADGNWLFLSSANLTHQAFSTNMELGVSIHGGDLPGQVEKQFRGLMDQGTLVPLEESPS